MQPLILNATAPPDPVRQGHLFVGAARNAEGQEISVDSRSLLRDGTPWLPVSGEFHFSRYPANEWRAELLKIKAGGIDILANYVIWNHHEEVEGRWNWSGRRDLRRFVELCGEVGLTTIVRCGPWCHGEARNGGFPEWLVDRTDIKDRSDDPKYLEKARVLYAQIAAQLEGLLWKDGGAVIGIQLENEYRGPAQHLLTLRQMAIDAGIDVPFYTRTGWPELQTPMPEGELLPLFGAYAEGFWDRELSPMPGTYGDNFLFRLERTDTAVATEQLEHRAGLDEESQVYPYFCCEIGGGMISSYHRRIALSPQDVEATALVKIGSGNNLQGYYMYHGGTNPQGQNTTLQEYQATRHTNYNDLPVKSYDFFAPLGEFGQVNPHYHSLRRLHLFLRDFGSALATYPAHLPAVRPTNSLDTQTLRWSVRTDGHSGFLFVSNYQRLADFPAREGVQFALQLSDGSLHLPLEPVTVPANSIFFWPFNLDLGGANLIHATAQPLCQLEEQNTSYFVFAGTAGVATEFVFSAAKVTVESANGALSGANGKILVRDLQSGTGEAIRLRLENGNTVVIVLLDEAHSLQCYKGQFAGRERIFLTPASLQMDGDELRLQAENPADLTVAVFPAPVEMAVDGASISPLADGIFGRFSATLPPRAEAGVSFEPIQQAGPPREITIGAWNVAQSPDPEAKDFTGAAVWRVNLPAEAKGRDLLLRVRYLGDVARFYLNGDLLTDDFFDGRAFDLGLQRFAPEIYQGELLLKILPIPKDAPIHWPDDVKAGFMSSDSALILRGIDVIERHEARFMASKGE